jgi:hypothetical protein
MFMKGRISLNGSMLTVLAILTASLPVLGRSADVDAQAAFERMKTLKGRWEATTASGQKVTTTFDLTANDTVLVERYVGSEAMKGAEMMTAYHLDGPSLILTHYCIAKNQPTLKAERFDAKTQEIQFEFVRASNLASPNAGHMRRALYRFEDANHFTTSWEFFQDGKKTMTETERFTRAK